MRRVILALAAGAGLISGTAGAAEVDVAGYITNPNNEIGTDNTANLTADATFGWQTGSCAIPVITNGFLFSMDSGGGNYYNHTGDISGTGGLYVGAGGIDILHIGGGTGNTYSGATTINNGPVSLEKSSGNALGGAITVQGTPSDRFPGVGSVVWTAADQVADSSDVTLTSSASLNLDGFSDQINDLYLVTGSSVQTGAGGVLKVARLYLDGVLQAEVAKTPGDGFVLGSGYIEVGASGPPVIVDPPAEPANPTPADLAADVHPATFHALDWDDSVGATGYDVYFWIDSESKPGAPTASVGLSDYTLPADLLSLSTYHWQVVAKNSVGDTPGAEWSFDTVARWELSGTLTERLDTIVGAGNSGLLVGNATTYWAGTTASSDVGLNGFELTLNNGGGNAQTYNGAITGPGTLRLDGRYAADWSPDVRLGGTVANSPGSVFLNAGRFTLNKPAGVDALAGPVTMSGGGSTKRIWLENSEQINDASTIDSTASSGLFELVLDGFDETIAGLDINTGDMVASGDGGVLTVSSLTVGGTVMGPGTYTAAGNPEFVSGTGSVVVEGATDPADPDNSTISASPGSVLANGASTSTITVTLLDAASNPATGKTVTLASSRGATDTVSAASGPSNSSGIVTFTVTSLTPGAPVFTATDQTSGVIVTQTASVTFSVNPPASSSQSSVAAVPGSVFADGSSTSTITVTLKDSGGTPIAGKSVTLASDRGASDTISAASGLSDAAGVVTFTVTSLTTGTAVFNATDETDGIVLTSTVSVIFDAATNVVDISNDLGPLIDGGLHIDNVVGAGNSGRLVGDVTTYWASQGFTVDLALNGNMLTVDSGGGNAMTAGGAISGDGTVRINAGGIGILHVAGSVGNSYTGTTEINNGPVRLAKDSGNALNGAITVNGPMSNNFPGTGTLLWGADNQLSDGSSLTLSAGSSLNLAGYSDTMGTLAITGDTNIYLGEATSVARFADSSATPWTADKQLVIREWNGSPAGGGAEGIFFGDSAGGLGAGQLARVGFMDPAGFDPGLYHAEILASGELVPTGTAVAPLDPPYDLSPAAAAARAAIHTSTGRAELSGAGTPLSDGTRIVFFGDSITWQNTYISMIDGALASGAGTSAMDITLVNRGINGGGALEIRDGAPDSGYPGSTPQAAFASLLTSDQADIAVVFIGVNDVWWRGTTPAAYEQALRDMAASAASQGVTMVFATIAAHDESPLGAGADDPAIDQFSAIVRSVATDTGAALVDLRAAFVAWWQNNNYEIRLDGSYVVLKQYGLLTYDGVHPTTLGNEMIADHIAGGILAALSSSSAFDTWTADKGLADADAGFHADPDGDGIDNGLEFVIGGEPNPAHPDWNSRNLLPTGEVAGDDFVFTFTRMNEAAYLDPLVEFDSDLEDPWTIAVDPDNATIVVTPGDPAATVTVTIPKAGNDRMFARLKVAAP